jgi:FkbM family methyltransferase
LGGGKMNFLLNFLNSCVARLFEILPRSGRQAIFERAIKRGSIHVGYDSLCRLADNLNVVALSVKGEYGVIQNSVSDRVISRYYAEHGRWAVQTNNTLKDFFAATGGTYIDVGANVGLTTIPVASDPRVSCLALEPEPGNFSYLAANIAANCAHGNVVAKRIAAFERADTLRFEIARTNFGDHRIRLRDSAGRMNEEARTIIDVEALPLDQLVDTKRVPIAVKIDTQGAEPFVVKGARKTLAAAGLLILEFWPYGMVRMGGNPDEVIRCLEQDFATLSLVDGENHMPSPPAPCRVVVDTLRQMVKEQAGNHAFYVDCIARKA